jgi:hypothetical protein
MAWVCEGPNHVGDRLVRSRLDRFSKRVSYVRADGKQRLNEKVLPAGRRCRSCVLAETEARLAGTLQESLEV